MTRTSLASAKVLSYVIAMSRRHTGNISDTADARALAMLHTLIGARTKPEDLRSLLRHFFTKRERAVFARRVEVAVRLAAGQSYRMIQDALGVSPNLIRKIHRWLSAERPDYRRLIPIRHHRRRKRTPRLRVERSDIPPSLETVLKRFPLWRNL